MAGRPRLPGVAVLIALLLAALFLATLPAQLRPARQALLRARDRPSPLRTQIQLQPTTVQELRIAVRQEEERPDENGGEDDAAALARNFEIRPSKVHGVGVFARRSFSAGEILFSAAQYVPTISINITPLASKASPITLPLLFPSPLSLLPRIPLLFQWRCLLAYVSYPAHASLRLSSAY